MGSMTDEERGARSTRKRGRSRRSFLVTERARTKCTRRKGTRGVGEWVDGEGEGEWNVPALPASLEAFAEEVGADGGCVVEGHLFESEACDERNGTE